LKPHHDIALIGGGIVGGGTVRGLQPKHASTTILRIEKAPALPARHQTGEQRPCRIFLLNCGHPVRIAAGK
jgi:hypothetical protein